jgi:three-Cys-motif partner protein
VIPAIPSAQHGRSRGEGYVSKPETIWEIDPHTQQKHGILRRYWEAWLPIMARFNQRLLYIDGFAGPGRYAGGEDGSPLIALKAARDHRARPTSEVVFIFIEKDQKRFEHLVETIDAIKATLPDNFKVHCVLGAFDDEMTEALDKLDQQQQALAPSLVFIDPFGFAQTPFRTVERILQSRRCEVLVTFMYEEINRFLNHPDHPETYDSLFGTDRWRTVLELDAPEERRRAIHDIYRDRLRGAGAEYVRSFEMLNRGNRTDYFLFFATHSLRGLEKMKESMWKVDASGAYQFSDFTDASANINLFPKEPDFARLKELLVAQFRGQNILIEKLSDFVPAETPFLRSHFKRQILKPMEVEGTLFVVDPAPTRKRGTFADGTTIGFR